MADGLSPADLDEEWLLAKAPPGLSDAQVEAFQEKVGILCCEAKMTDNEARRNAFNFMFGDGI
jgi:hypothetical protein